MKPALIVFYSLTGTTKQAAQELARRSGWEIAQIKDARERRGFFGYARCAIESAFGRNTEFEYQGPDPAGFELVVFGAPVWVGHIASPLRSFYAQHRDHLKHVAFFFTFGGGGAERVVRQAKSLSGNANVPVLFLNASDMQSGTFRTRFDPFIKQASVAGV